MNKSLNIAHRGFSGAYPENTMLAFMKAVEIGSDGIETDVQLTKDKELVLCHDETVDRTTDGHGLICDFTYSELKRLNAARKFKHNFKKQNIPTLDEFLEYVRDKNLLINLELKNSIIRYEGMEEMVYNRIYKYNLKDNIIVSSFNHYSIKECIEIDESIKAGLLYDCCLYEPYNYCSHLGAHALHPSFYSLTEEIVKKTHDINLKINTYTVNEESDMKHMLELGIDGIITNYPDKLKELM